MSWLEGAASTRSSTTPEPDTFAQRWVVVERDLETEEMATEYVDGHQWVVAYPSYERLAAQYSGDEVDHLMLLGRDLKKRVRQDDTIGLRYRQDEDNDDVVIQQPNAAPVQRVVVE
ncbi:hypothetical protein [Actinopolyspora halophila]|uniref:hypothetical protein n=1 Tax=Actinopolyspora halophila TaxID=1850 RepID=UPI00037EB695|nr:hypothetical protein [Actinopolyspora halophila]